MAGHKERCDGGYQRQAQWSCVCIAVVQEGERGGNAKIKQSSLNEIAVLMHVKKCKFNIDFYQKNIIKGVGFWSVLPFFMSFCL